MGYAPNTKASIRAQKQRAYPPCPLLFCSVYASLQSYLGADFMDLSIKGVPEEQVAILRVRAKANHRSLQGELRALIDAATTVRPQKFSRDIDHCIAVRNVSFRFHHPKIHEFVDRTRWGPASESDPNSSGKSRLVRDVHVGRRVIQLTVAHLGELDEHGDYGGGLRWRMLICDIYGWLGMHDALPRPKDRERENPKILLPDFPNPC